MKRSAWSKVELVSALVVALAAGRSTPAAAAAAAGDSAEAETLIRQGVQLRSQNKPARALPFFEKAYETARTPRTAGQLGLCELDLGYYAEAERYLSEALAEPEHPWIAKNKATLKRQLDAARANVGELAVTGSPAGAEIWLNKKQRGVLPLAAPLRLDKGRVDIELRAAGFLPATDTVTIAGGKRLERAYTLARDPAVPPPAPSAPVAERPAPAVGSGTSVPPESPGPTTLTSAPPPAPAPETGMRRQLAWVAGGAAAGALVLGTMEAFNAASKRDAFNDHTGYVNGVFGKDCGTASLSSACKPLKDSYDQALTLSIVGFAAAGALAAGASVLFLMSSSGHGAAEPDGSAHALACIPDPLARGLACSLRF